MNAQVHFEYVPIGSTAMRFPAHEGRTQPLVVVVLVSDPAATMAGASIEPVVGELDEEPTWEDAEWL